MQVRWKRLLVQNEGKERAAAVAHQPVKEKCLKDADMWTPWEEQASLCSGQAARLNLLIQWTEIFEVLRGFSYNALECPSIYMVNRCIACVKLL